MVSTTAIATLFFALVGLANASPIETEHRQVKRCTATISSYTDVATAVASKCATVGKEPRRVKSGTKANFIAFLVVCVQSSIHS
jgi:hypothetical protein